jgi:hypothetical protein
LRHGFRLLLDVPFTLGLLASLRFLSLALLSFLFRSLPLFLFFLKVCGMEWYDFRLEGELPVFLQFILKVPPLLHQAAHIVGIDFPLLRILRLEQRMLF